MASLPVSPLAPALPDALPALDGVVIETGNSGTRYRGRDDLLLLSFDRPASIAGVLTRSLASSAPVDWCRAHLRDGAARAIIVNAGNANAFTGSAGDKVVRRTADAVAARLGCSPGEVFIASTGVIGQILPEDAFAKALPGLARQAPDGGWRKAAEAISTTDTFPKLVTRTARIGGAPVRLNGIIKGSGMIAPDMATLLGFVVTDAAIPAPLLQPLLARATAKSVNCITVDGDTSTSDTLLLAATGTAAHPPVGAGGASLRGFAAALTDLLVELAQMVVRDGEGAAKFIAITVGGAHSAGDARRIAFTIANSPLVKTAIAGEDANWGRIVAAVGRAGVRADRDRIAVAIGGVTIAKDGMAVPGYDEAPVARHLKGREIAIAVDLGLGSGQATVWTCDLTHGYISINADYRS